MNNQKWQHICKVVNDAQKAAMHCSIATVDAQLQPTITPIGTLFLRENQSGFFFDTYTESLQQNLPKNSKACIQAVNSSRLFWLKSLFKGEFSDYPGVRLYVEIGDLSLANAEELAQISRRIQILKWTKGSQLIWSDFTHVRDFTVQSFRWVKYPKMMPFHQ
ncbi:pyridoxamine 5'-phosphate oxidase family protein [Acinetobacter terrestris]|uniref:Pyridoxamine 5'-phosphate oxidase family protein n=1 Tax=Acinetobacter terrestris TaxID=2529843 RepID=A0AAW6UPU0_9GAMM|nr:pyridoxamine 5'-phosphate oxidase family protein [Acinetobacter terrestris]MDK1683281.1 pyridoxamine 5'-phosphate oxidase family protein [Acinetobacter terrestris]